MITFTEKAAEKVKEIAEAENLQGQGIRLRVIGGGCSGFSYDLYFDDEPGRWMRLSKPTGFSFTWTL